MCDDGIVNDCCGRKVPVMAGPVVCPMDVAACSSNFPLKLPWPRYRRVAPSGTFVGSKRGPTSTICRKPAVVLVMFRLTLTSVMFDGKPDTVRDAMPELKLVPTDPPGPIVGDEGLTVTAELSRAPLWFPSRKTVTPETPGSPTLEPSPLTSLKTVPVIVEDSRVRSSRCSTNRRRGSFLRA